MAKRRAQLEKQTHSLERKLQVIRDQVKGKFSTLIANQKDLMRRL